MEDRRDHVLGQRRTEPVPQRVSIQWPLAGIEGHQVFAAVGPSRDDDRVLADAGTTAANTRSEEHTSELQSRPHLVCRLLLEKKKKHVDVTTGPLRHSTSDET